MSRAADLITDAAVLAKMDAMRYEKLSAWIRSGQPINSSDNMVGAMLKLVQRRKQWPIPQNLFDAAIDAVIKKETKL